jgi:hypothetical protein
MTEATLANQATPPGIRTGKFRVLDGWHCQPVYPPQYRAQILRGTDKQGNPVEEVIKIPISRIWLGRVLNTDGTVYGNRGGEIVESRVDLVKRHNRPGSIKYERVSDSTPADPGHEVEAENLRDFDEMPVYDDFKASARPMTDDEIEAAYKDLLRRKGEVSSSDTNQQGQGAPVVNVPPSAQMPPVLDSSVGATLESMSAGDLRKWCAEEEIVLAPSVKSKDDILKAIREAVGKSGVK